MQEHPMQDNNLQYMLRIKQLKKEKEASRHNVRKEQLESINIAKQTSDKTDV